MSRGEKPDNVIRTFVKRRKDQIKASGGSEEVRLTYGEMRARDIRAYGKYLDGLQPGDKMLSLGEFLKQRKENQSQE